ncbi:MAG: hypothetical protein FWD11_11150 [Micrococcales bacterium]|nr:hypothetical protein [Micrococcales bacterium]
MKKTFVVALAVAVGLGLAGCGGDDAPNQEVKSPTDAGQTGTTGTGGQLPEGGLMAAVPEPGFAVTVDEDDGDFVRLESTEATVMQLVDWKDQLLDHGFTDVVVQNTGEVSAETKSFDWVAKNADGMKVSIHFSLGETTIEISQ